MKWSVLPILLLFSFLLLPLGTADNDFDPIKTEECLPLLKYCQNCTFVNITTIEFPNGTVMPLDYETEQIGTGTFLNDTGFCGQFRTKQIGPYTYSTLSDPDGILKVEQETRQVTANGRPLPTGLVIVFFVLCFLVIMALLVTFMASTFLYLVEYLQDGDKRPVYGFDMLIYNISGYIVVWVFYGLAMYYLGNPFINKIIGWLVFALSWTNFAIPILAFILSLLTVGWEEIIRKIKGENGKEK